jgi:hypothetical protein
VSLARERLAQPFDIDYEIARARRRRYMYDRGLGMVLPVYRDPYVATYQNPKGGGERIYGSYTPGAAKTFASTGEVVINDTATMGAQPYIASTTIQAAEGRSTAFTVTARGIYSTTGAPTWTLNCRLGAQSSVAGPLVGGTAAVAWGSGATNLGWEMDLDLAFEVIASGANSTVRGCGRVSVSLTASTSLTLDVFGGGVQPGTVTNVDVEATNHFNICANCGTASASNSIQLLQLLILGW